MGFKSRLMVDQGTEVMGFLLHVTDGRMRVWRHKNTAYTPRNIQPTVLYGGGSVMVWGCISHDCKLDLVSIQDNLTGDQYIRDVLQLDVRCSVVIAAAIPDAMLLPTDECYAQEVLEHVYNGLTCPKYALWDSNPGSWQGTSSQLFFTEEAQ
jgi:hypothetical protein